MSRALNHLGLCLLLGLSAAPAAVVNIDIQPAGGETMSGGATAVLASTGSFWNSNGPNHLPTALATDTGTTSGLILTANLESPPFGGDGDALFRDYMMGTARISGLLPGHEYQVVFYSGANLQTIFRVAQPFTRLSPAPGYSPYEHKQLPGIEGVDFVRGLVVADPQGAFTVEVNLGALAGLQVALPNPEPSVLLLLALGAPCTALTRRRPC